MAKPGRKPKKEIQENLQKEKEDIFKNLEEKDNYYNSIQEIPIEKLIPNVFNGVVINTDDEGRQNLYLPINMTGLGFRNWKNQTRGGVFSKDVNRYCLNNKYGKYLSLINDNETLIVRVIEDEEIPDFRALKLVDGKVVDKPYMMLKKVNNNQKLTTTDIYSGNNETTSQTDDSEEDDDLEESSESKSLLNE